MCSLQVTCIKVHLHNDVRVLFRGGGVGSMCERLPTNLSTLRKQVVLLFQLSTSAGPFIMKCRNKHGRPRGDGFGDDGWITLVTIRDLEQAYAAVLPLAVMNQRLKKEEENAHIEYNDRAPIMTLHIRVVYEDSLGYSTTNNTNNNRRRRFRG